MAVSVLPWVAALTIITTGVNLGLEEATIKGAEVLEMVEVTILAVVLVVVVTIKGVVDSVMVGVTIREEVDLEEVAVIKGVDSTKEEEEVGSDMDVRPQLNNPTFEEFIDS